MIRAHALGRFEGMPIASATHPSMLYYLNNAESSKYSPNENHGRGLLELHTVGVDGGYDETDMRNSALVMTGFTADWETTTFRYEPSWHHTGRVRVMDWTSANGSGAGSKDVAISYLRYLARHPRRRTAAPGRSVSILAEILEKRCGAGSVTDVFPGVGTARPGVLQQRPT